MRAVTINLVDNLTRATFRLAEFGFLGETILTLTTIPLRWGEPHNERREVVYRFLTRRPLFPTWWIVGTSIIAKSNKKI